MAKSEADQINIKITADTSGGVKTEQELEKVRAKAKSVANDTKKSSTSMAQSMGGVSRAAGLVQKALMGLGVVGVFTTLISAVDKIRDSFSKAKEKAEEFKKEAEAKALAKEIENLDKSYEKLVGTLERAAKAEQNQLELIDMEVQARRELTRAKTDADEAAELAAVDPDALDAEEQRKAITAKYGALRATQNASNKKEDLTLSRQKLTTAADANEREAAAAEAQAAALEAQAGKVMNYYREAAGKSVSTNDKDRTGFWSSFGGNLKDIVTFNWGNVGEERTDAGDKVRTEWNTRAEELKKQAEELAAQAEKLRAEAAGKRTNAEHARAKGRAMNGLVEVADIDETTTQVTNNISESTANRALAKKRKEIERDKDYVSRVGPGRLAALQEQVAVEEGKKSAAEAKAAKEKEDVWRAQQALNAFNLDNQGRTGSSITAQRKTLMENISRETAEAAEAENELKGVLSTFHEVVKDLKTQIENVKNEVKAAAKRTSVANAESPSAV